MQHFVASLVSRRYRPLDRNTGVAYAASFRENCHCILPHFFLPEFMWLLRAEADRLVQAATRKEIQIPGSQNTIRRMHTIGTLKLNYLTSVIPLIYFDNDLRHFLSGITGEDVLIVPDKNERYVLNALLHPGDRHGAHVDDYAFALNIFTECPPVDSGGRLNVAQNSTDFRDLSNGRSVEIAVRPGDVCFLKSDTSVHEVLPLTGEGRRIAFNLVYRSTTNGALESYSSNDLYKE